MPGVIIAVIVLAALALLLTLRAELFIEYHEKQLTVKAVAAGGLLRITLFPKKEKKKKRDKPEKEGEEEKEEKPKKEQTEKEPEKEKKPILQQVNTLFDFLEFLASETRSKVRVKKFVLHAGFGTGDACDTAILIGLCYAAAYNFLGVVDRGMEFEAIDVEINPVFDREVLDVDFSSIISTRPVHIINIGIKALKFLNKRW